MNFNKEKVLFLINKDKINLIINYYTYKICIIYVHIVLIIYVNTSITVKSYFN